MAARCILLVDDHRDIVRLLHSAMQALGHELDIIDAPSGEEALLEASHRRIDLLVADYRLPGISGVEMMRKIRARNPDLKVIFISGVTERKARDEMHGAGAVAMFDKPIPMADFLDAVERSLGLVRTIFPPEMGAAEAQRHTLSELLAGFRQNIAADAVFLISERGRVLARAGDLYDSSMEVSLVSVLISIYGAGLNVSRFLHQERPDNYHVFRGVEHDLVLIPVDSSHALLLAGRDLARADRIVQTMQEMLSVRADVENILQSLGVAPLSRIAESAVPERDAFPQSEQGEPEVDLDALFASADKTSKVKDIDAFWDEAVEKTSNPPTNPDVISYEEARKLGLTPKRTGGLFTGPFKKKG